MSKAYLQEEVCQ